MYTKSVDAFVMPFTVDATTTYICICMSVCVCVIEMRCPIFLRRDNDGVHASPSAKKKKKPSRPPAFPCLL